MVFNNSSSYMAISEVWDSSFIGGYMWYLLTQEPTLGDMLQNGVVDRGINIDGEFWFKVFIICCIVSLVGSLLVKPNPETILRNKKARENIQRNRNRVFGGGAADMSHNQGNIHYKQGNVRNGCGSCIMHGCVKKDEAGNPILDKDGKPCTPYNPNKCKNCKNNSWCICYVG